MEALLVTSKPVARTWCGGPGVAQDFARTENAIRRAGERVITIRWADGTVLVKHMTGDGRYPTAVVHAEETLPAGTTDEEVAAWATSRLT